MSNYKETQQSGAVYTRASNIMVGNGLEQKSIQFREEQVFIAENGDVLFKPLMGVLSENLTEENMLTSFAIVNPETGEEVGAYSNYVDVQVLLHSLYLFLANRRDERAQEQELEQELEQEQEQELDQELELELELELEQEPEQ
jgi:hypothetical protein